MPTAAYRTIAQRLDVDENTRTIRFVASTNDVDRWQSIIRQHWNTSNFDNNPVALFGHQHDMPAIGRVADWSTDGELTRSEADIEFAETDLGEELFKLYSTGMMRAVSVGFYPGAWEMVERSGQMVETMGSLEEPNELLELSCVTVPGNQNAVSLAAARALSSSEPLMQLIKEIRQEQLRQAALLDEFTKQRGANAAPVYLLGE